MHYLSFIEHMSQKYNCNHINYLVSGIDENIQSAILGDILMNNHLQNLIVIDDSGTFSSFNDLALIKRYGFEIKNGFSENYCLYNPFHLHSFIDITKIRQLFEIFEYDEAQKGKLISYLNFIIHLEQLDKGTCNLDLNKLAEYSSILAVEKKIQKLVQQNVINNEQQIVLLSKYSECSSAGADLENIFYNLLPFVSGEKAIQNEFKKVIVFPIYTFDDDQNTKKAVLQLLKYGFKSNMSFLILDKGRGERKYISHFIETFPLDVDIHIFSNDIFTLVNEEMLNHILNRFIVKIYSKHLAMSSAQIIEKICGDIEIVKEEKSVTYDRRFFANKPIDILFNKNKVESVVKMAPIREAKYRKEMIIKFPPGKGIIDFNGQTTLFSI